MGSAFMAASKRWAFPVQSPPLSATPSPAQHIQRPTSLKGRDATAESRKFTPHVTLEEGELLCRDAFNTYRAVHSIQNTYADVNDVKGEIRKSLGSFRKLNRPMKMEDEYVCLANLTPSESLQFGLLMENLDSITDIFAGKDSVRLERDILVQIERLGALRLFHASLLRTFMAPTTVPSQLQISKHSIDWPVDYSLGEHDCKIIVRTGKKEERKSRRRRALDKATQLSTLSASSKKIHKFEEPSVSMVSSKLKRVVVARNESQMSRGVKELADLHRICTRLEAQTGRAASYARWAELAGTDQKTLQQRLQFGWYCRDKLIKSTRSLVVYIARNYRGVGIAFDDLLQAGTMGVLKGAERFDHTRGYRFSTYVQYWIRKSMLALVARHSKGILRIPVKMQKAIKQIQKARRAFYTRNGRYPSDEETADIMGLPIANIRLARKCSRVVGSIDQEMGIGWPAKYMEVTSDASVKVPEETIMRRHMKNDVAKLLESLHPKERQVLMLRYGLDDGRCKSLDEVGRHFHVTKEWIRQLQKTALAKLRKEETQRELEYYLHN